MIGKPVLSLVEEEHGNGLEPALIHRHSTEEKTATEGQKTLDPVTNSHVPVSYNLLSISLKSQFRQESETFPSYSLRIDFFVLWFGIDIK